MTPETQQPNNQIKQADKAPVERIVYSSIVRREKELSDAEFEQWKKDQVKKK